MRMARHLVLSAALLGTAANFAIAAPSSAQRCDQRAFGAAIDQAAQTLRTLNKESERRFQERLASIGKAKGWTAEQSTAKSNEAMNDSRLEKFNVEIEELVSQLDNLSATPGGEVSCDRLNELKTVRDRLVKVMGQKSGFILAQLETENQRPAEPVQQATPAPQPAVPPAPRQETAEKEPQPAPEQAAPNPDNKSDGKSDSSWAANVSRSLSQDGRSNAQRPAALTPPAPAPQPSPQPLAPLPLRPAPQNNGRVAALTPPPAPNAHIPTPSGYSKEEIRAAGQGVFGSLTSEFAIVINRAFKHYGEPNGYIVGDEGGGAFLAGIRYGKGELFTRVNGVEAGPTNIYWQGPSVGFDVGATGSRTLFLVYNLDNPQTLYERYPGIDGSAYVAGGFGMTVFKRGETIIVPIRTGLGLRLGASLTYIKFTERASLNPF